MVTVCVKELGKSMHAPGELVRMNDQEWYAAIDFGATKHDRTPQQYKDKVLYILLTAQHGVR